MWSVAPPVTHPRSFAHLNHCVAFTTRAIRYTMESRVGIRALQHPWLEPWKRQAVDHLATGADFDTWRQTPGEWALVLPAFTVLMAALLNECVRVRRSSHSTISNCVTRVFFIVPFEETAYGVHMMCSYYHAHSYFVSRVSVSCFFCRCRSVFCQSHSWANCLPMQFPHQGLRSCVTRN